MELWLDTIDVETVADGVKTGIISGVTTNPSILSKASHVLDSIQKLLDVQFGPVAVQVTSHDPEEMIDEAQSIFEFSNRTIVKIPINHAGLCCIQALKKTDIPIMGTGIIFPSQALLAANHDIAYIAPYFSHMDDPRGTIKTIVDVLQKSGASTKVLAASLKQIDDIIYCALLGVEAVTIKPDLYHKLIANQSKVAGFLERFSTDWEQSHGKLSIKEALTIIPNYPKERKKKSADHPFFGMHSDEKKSVETLMKELKGNYSP